jgi:hypothetical protein
LGAFVGKLSFGESVDELVGEFFDDFSDELVDEFVDEFVGEFVMNHSSDSRTMSESRFELFTVEVGIGGVSDAANKFEFLFDKVSEFRSKSSSLSSSNS